MKLIAYSYRQDEAEFFEKFAQQYGVTITLCKEKPDLRNASLAEGCEAVSVITTPVPGELIEAWHALGVRFISTRTIGYEHVDCKKAWELGMTVSNVAYSTGSVADYTVMLMLMCLRNMKTILKRYESQDFSLKHIRGREIANLTVGVIGTGKIGRHVIQNLSGFGCQIYAYDLSENEEVKACAKYVSLDVLFRQSDIITLHMPATSDTRHMINQETIKQMKTGALLINTARGSLIDTAALIDGLEAGKVGGAALDVLEEEGDYYYGDFKNQVIPHRHRAILNEMPNVILLPHTAFYTDQAVSDMVERSILSCLYSKQGKHNPWEIVPNNQ